MKHNLIQSLTIFLFFFLLSLLNIRSSHNWGDDFSQYIHQAINITKGESQLETGLIQSDYTLEWQAPKFYPYGLPLLLSIPYAIGGNQIQVLDLVICLSYFGLAITLFYLYQQTTGSKFYAFLLTLVIIANPWTINIKASILSDLPYTFFSLLNITSLVYFLKKPTKLIQAIFAISLFLSLATRSVSLSLLLGIIVYSCFPVCQKPAWRYKGLTFLTLTFISLTGYVLLNNYFGLTLSNGYNKIFNINDFSLILKGQFKMLKPYLFEFQKYLYTINEFIQPAILMISISILGIIYKLKKSPKIEIYDIYLILYLLLIFLTKVGDGQGFRLLFPIIPIIILYPSLLIKSLKIKQAIALLVILSYLLPLFKLQQNKNTTIDGPQHPEAQEAFNFIANNIPNSARIVFFKARALSLYGQRQSHPVIPKTANTPDQIKFLHQEYQKLSINYYLVDKYSTDLENTHLRQYLLHYPDFPQVWNNDRYALYTNH